MKPVLALTIGDPAGIGPEITLKAMLDPAVREMADCVAVGSQSVLRQAAGFCGLCIRFVPFPCEFPLAQDELALVDMDNVDLSGLKMGTVSGMCGRAAYEYIEKAIHMAQEGTVSAVVTGPINKESLRAAEVPYIGHTEIFGGLLGVKNPLTMFETRGLRVFFLSRHISLREACDAVTAERIVACGIQCFREMERLGLAHGNLAVAGLNPHSGEHGLFGTEEQTAVVPAVQELRRQGYKVEGPVSADSVFHLALQGKYDAVLSLYHDQGHIATKTLDFERTISLTGGLPFLRSSVDHGTAFDLAGKGVASAVSMIEAIRVGGRYALHYRSQSK